MELVRHIEQPWIFTRNWYANRNGIGAMETSRAIVEAHETIGIAEGDTDEAFFGSLKRVSACWSEMRRVADGNRTNAECFSNLGSAIHSCIGRKCSMSIISIQRFDRAKTCDPFQVGAAVDPAALQR